MILKLLSTSQASFHSPPGHLQASFQLSVHQLFTLQGFPSSGRSLAQTAPSVLGFQASLTSLSGRAEAPPPTPSSSIHRQHSRVPVHNHHYPPVTKPRVHTDRGRLLCHGHAPGTKQNVRHILRMQMISNEQGRYIRLRRL